MSLIHDALKSMDADAPQQSRPGSPARAPAAARGGRPAWLDGLLAFCVVVGAGVAGWYVWQGRALPRLAPAPAPAALAQTEPPAVPVPVPVPDQGTGTAAAAAAADVPAPAPAVVPEAARAADEQPVPADTARHEAAPAATAAAAPVDAAPARASAPEPARASTASRQRRTRAAHRVTAPAAAQAQPAPKVDDTPVQVHFTRFVAAMRGGQTSDAERELGALKVALPSDSLGLMRAQAWFDLRAGNDAAAARTYRQILDRMPGDDEAAVNLASIQARQADQEGARATLDAAARLNPDSAALRAALAQYTPNARQ